MYSLLENKYRPLNVNGLLSISSMSIWTPSYHKLAVNVPSSNKLNSSSYVIKVLNQLNDNSLSESTNVGNTLASVVTLIVANKPLATELTLSSRS